MKNRLSGLIDLVIDKLYDIYSFWISKYEMIQRMLFWGWSLRHNIDFDATSLYQVIYLKLCRIHFYMRKNGHLIWNSSYKSNSMRKLAECKILAKRLYEDNYHTNYERFMNMYKKAPKSSTKSNNRHIGTSFDDCVFNMYPNAKVIPDHMYRCFLTKAFKQDSDKRTSDKNRFFYLLSKYQDIWWD